MAGEGNFQKKVLKFLREKIGGVWYNTHGSSFSSDGTPDIVGCKNGKFYAFELKNPNKKGRESKQQSFEGRRIVKNGGVYLCTTSIEEIGAVFI